jgi:hypothetical protein
MSRPQTLSQVKGEHARLPADSTYSAGAKMVSCPLPDAECGGAGFVREISGGLGLAGRCGGCGADLVGQFDTGGPVVLEIVKDAVVDGRVVPAPSNPMGVARAFVADRHTIDGQLVLLQKGGLFYQWRRRHWAEVERRDVRDELYEWLEHAVYEKLTKEGADLVAWEPTRVKVGNVLEAVEAIGHVDEALAVPSWLDDTPINPAEVISVANGLLHVPSRTLSPHRPAFFNHHSLAFAYDAGASAPTCGCAS